ncbi:hypothetical protein ACQ4PT_051301 [Festuca glaucescens]
MDATLPELPQDILMDIFTLLEIPDLVRAASVCPSWCSAYTSLCNLGQYKQSQTPCLLYTCETDSESDARLYNLVEKRSYKLTLPGPPIRSRYLIGSSNGWLVTADDRSQMHLLNPITVEQIALPSVITLEPVAPIFDETGAVYKYNFTNRAARPLVTFALDELRIHRKAFVFYDTSAERYIVVLIHNPEGQLSFAWLGDDKWTFLPPHTFFHDCVYMDDLLYAVAARGEIFAFNLRGPIATKKLIVDRAKDYICENIYIVQAPCGDLLQVWRLEDETVYAEKLVKINSLDDHVLVLGHNQSLCLSAEEYPQLKENRVYFTDDHELYIFGWKNNRRDIGVFDLENNSREELVSPQLWSNWPPPIWANSASGLAVHDDCKIKFSDLKARRGFRFIVFKIDEKAMEIKVERLGETSHGYEEFTNSLPADECRYAVYDLDFVTDENCQKSKIFFFSWSPDTARTRSKMLYASSKDRFRREMDGIQCEIQATDPSEMSLDIIKGRAH